MNSKIIKFFWALFLIYSQSYADARPLGDRLILTINGIPYSQLQIEEYLNVKEALRDDPSKSQLVSASNWGIALASFMKDMTLYQEANRTSGFRPSRDVTAKAASHVQKVLENHERFRIRFEELGFDTPTIRECVSRILSIENLRRSRNSIQPAKKTPMDAPAIKWEDELMKRALIRWFEKGKTYEALDLNAK